MSSAAAKYYIDIFILEHGLELFHFEFVVTGYEFRPVADELVFCVFMTKITVADFYGASLTERFFAYKTYESGGLIGVVCTWLRSGEYISTVNAVFNTEGSILFAVLTLHGLALYREWYYFKIHSLDVTAAYVAVLCFRIIERAA